MLPMGAMPSQNLEPKHQLVSLSKPVYTTQKEVLNKGNDKILTSGSTICARQRAVQTEVNA
jgi:hypothetical protein